MVLTKRWNAPRPPCASSGGLSKISSFLTALYKFCMRVRARTREPTNEGVVHVSADQPTPTERACTGPAAPSQPLDHTRPRLFVRASTYAKNRLGRPLLLVEGAEQVLNKVVQLHLALDAARVQVSVEQQDGRHERQDHRCVRFQPASPRMSCRGTRAREKSARRARVHELANLVGLSWW